MKSSQHSPMFKGGITSNHWVNTGSKLKTHSKASSKAPNSTQFNPRDEPSENVKPPILSNKKTEDRGVEVMVGVDKFTQTSLPGSQRQSRQFEPEVMPQGFRTPVFSFGPTDNALIPARSSNFFPPHSYISQPPSPCPPDPSIDHAARKSSQNFFYQF